jgi:DNA-binding response OmpR family regulator
MNQDMEKIGYILIVNSDPTMRHTVSRYFSDHNFPTNCASNWSELKRSATPPSLIIMDVQLGLNDGSIGCDQSGRNQIFLSSSPATAPTKLIVSSASNLAPTITS